MTEIAYMTRSSWAQHGTMMEQNSTKIREWLGLLPSVFAVVDKKRLVEPNSADQETLEFVDPAGRNRFVCQFNELRPYSGKGETIGKSLVLLHPYKDEEGDLLQNLAASRRFHKIFVMVWSEQDIILNMLMGIGAFDLHAPQRVTEQDSLLTAAAKSMVDHEYNGLETGDGKDVVVQLLRAFRDSGYPLDKDVWLRAYFAAGGTTKHAHTVEKFIREMQQGRNHRIKPRFRPNIVEILREQVDGITSRPSP